MSFTFKQSWRKQAACLNMPLEVFFKNGGKQDKAKAICISCSVKKECLELALLTEKHQASRSSRHGIYGGLNAVERAKLNTCRYADCLKSAPRNERFCSEEHKNKHESDVGNYIPVPKYEYYMKGSLNAKAPQA